MLKDENLFLKLDFFEIQSELRSICSSNTLIKIWDSSYQVLSIPLKKVESDSLFIEENTNYFIKNNNEYFLCFTYNQMSYFFKISIKINKHLIKLIPITDIFRSEKRKNTRIFTSLNLRSSLDINFPEKFQEIESNVLSIKKEHSTNFEILKQFDQDFNKNPLNRGLKVLDLSTHGLSFICSKNELLLTQEYKLKEATLFVNKEKFPLTNIEYIYNLNYIDPKMKKVNLIKNGILFTSSKEYIDFINQYYDGTDSLTPLDESFQKFISSRNEQD